MFNNIANYSAELVLKSHMHGWDPQFDGDKILREDMEKYGTEESVQRPLNDVYLNFLLSNQVDLQILLHTYFWTELSPIFKAELAEAFTFFKALSPNSNVNAEGLVRAFKEARWPQEYREALRVHKELLPKYDQFGKQNLNFMEFSKLALDFTSKLDVDADCLHCFRNTKDQILTLIDFMQCQREEIRPFNLCTAVAKKLNCKRHLDDVCRAEVRYMPLQCTHESLCEAASDLFKRYGGIQTEVLNA